MSRNHLFVSLFVAGAAINVFADSQTIGTVAGGGRPGSAATA